MMRPASGAVRPMTRAGTVSTTGVSVVTPGVPAKAFWMAGRTGASSTAPSTDRQLDSRSTTAWVVPARLPVAGSSTGATPGCAESV